MSQYYYPGPQANMNQHTFGPSTTTTHHNNHRSRRSTRFSSSHQHPPRHYNKQQRSQNQKETVEAAQAAAFRKDFEAARSFDLEDDELFCPWHLLTEDDLHSIHSSSSDRSSSSGSGSPDNSPVQIQPQPTSNFTMPPTSHHTFQPVASSSHLRIHQPQAQRTRNAIPIVDPNSRNTSPPQSVSPARQAQKSWYGPRRQQW